MYTSCYNAVSRLSGNPMQHRTDDLRIDELKPLLPPGILMEELPATDDAETLVEQSRGEIGRVLAGDDDRLLVVTGPCSIHDPEAALEYGMVDKIIVSRE